MNFWLVTSQFYKKTPIAVSEQNLNLGIVDLKPNSQLPIAGFKQ